MARPGPTTFSPCVLAVLAVLGQPNARRPPSLAQQPRGPPLTSAGTAYDIAADAASRIEGPSS